MKKLKMSLNKANKLKEKLKHEVNDYFKTSTFRMLDTKELGTANIKIPPALDSKKAIELVQKKVKETERTFNLALNLKQDYANVKEALFKSNVDLGISKKLEEVETLKSYVNVYKNLLQNHGNLLPTDVTEEYIKNSMELMKESEQYKDLVIGITLFESQIVETKLKEYQERINNVEDEIMSLNANNHIELELHDDVAGLLGF